VYREGDLTVSKTVTGEWADLEKEFTFTVTLSEAVSGTFGDMTFVDGVATFTLKNGESATALNLPADVTYTVTEAEYNEYLTTSTGETGIIVDGETIVVRTLDRDGGVTINGGLGEDDGVDLREDEETGAWRVVGYDDLATYTEHGVTTLIIESDTTYTDTSDPQQIPTIVRGADIVDAMMKADEYATFDQYNTRVTIEGGRLVSISHLYTP